jgi:cytochrome c oxidase subunit 3
MADHGHEGHHPNQAHHFDTLQQQVEAGNLGMWLFLATEVLLFAGLFCAYTVYRYTHPDVFEFASKYLDTKWGAINTLVLIASSWTVALGVHAAQTNNNKKCVQMMVWTLLGAAAFMGIKAVEYTHKFHDDLVWGVNFDPQNATPREVHGEAWGIPMPGEEAAEATAADDKAATEAASTERTLLSSTDYVPAEAAEEAALAKRSTIQPAPMAAAPASAGDAREQRVREHWDPQKLRKLHIFFGIYFCMTGLHGLHVIIGAIVIVWVMLRAMRGDFSSEYYLPVHLAGLYWHLVDLIWIFLFPLLYLIG